LLAYLIIFSITVAGVSQAPWWSAAIGACILALLPFVERQGMWTAPSGADDVHEPIASMVALINGSAAACAAFLLGRATGWLWGI
jgi:hypothetical protein